MKIHSDILTREHFDYAASLAGVTLVECSLLKGSRSRARAFKFYLSGSGRFGGQWGNQNHRSATWDEWGIFLNRLFDIDPAAHCGKNSYLSAEHYHWTTGGRFRTLQPSQQHLRHNWLSGESYGPSVTGSYYLKSCKCGATRRHIAYGHDWLEVAA